MHYFYIWNYFEKTPEGRRLSEEEEASPIKEVVSHEDSNIALLGYESTLVIENLQTLFLIMELYGL